MSMICLWLFDLNKNLLSTGNFYRYFWDFTNPAAAEYFISSVTESLNSAAVDGTFTDDVSGLPAEHAQVMSRINMTSKQLEELQIATLATHSRLVTTLIAAGKYNWQAFGGGDGAGPGINQDECATFIRSRCSEEFQRRAMMMDAGHASNQSVAAFLIVRPPIAFLGWGWESDDKKNWDDIFLLQPGTPTGLCTEEKAGVFLRRWTNGVVKLDCNTWTASLPFPSL